VRPQQKGITVQVLPQQCKLEEASVVVALAVVLSQLATSIMVTAGNMQVLFLLVTRVRQDPTGWTHTMCAACMMIMSFSTPRGSEGSTPLIF
jgi:hypothetical protein